MQARKFLLVVFVLWSIIASAQKTIKVYGVVSDEKTGELLQAATIKNSSDIQGSSITNMYGYYSINIQPNRTVNIEVSFVGYQTQSFTLKLSGDTVLDVKLIPGIELGEFTISASKVTSGNKTQIGMLALANDVIKWAPFVAGESNVMASLKTLPGVSAGKEGSSELYVRGGSNDQNLVLLDKAPVYNLNHAFGLLSVFNSSALKNVSLYKGGIPAEFGGRLSSVLDITIKEGNRQSLNGDFTISTIAATVTAEGPIIKDKASFLVSARRSWPDILITGIAAGNRDDMTIGYYFADINLKTNFSIKNKHHFYVSYYLGQDKLFAMSKTEHQQSKTEQGWGNIIASSRYQSVSSNGAFNDVLVYFSSFDEFELNGLNSEKNKSLNKNMSALKELGLKTNREWNSSNYFKYKLGINALWRSIQPPYRITEENGIEDEMEYSPKEYQKEIAAFASGTYSGKKVYLQFGLRSGMFGTQLSDYFSFEPRLSVFYHLSNSFSIKAGAMKNIQSLVAMPKSVRGMPGYTWLPTTGNLEPQTSWQTSAGFNWQNGNFNFDSEIYYKWMENIAGNYFYPSNLYQSTQWYDIIEQGKGKTYGLDFLSQYNAEKFQVNLKYSLSKAEHSFSFVLNGLWIPANYDIRHDISLTGTWTIQDNEQNKKWFTGNLSIHSGVPVSLPAQSIQSMLPIFKEESYDFDYSYFDYYNRPNNARLKTYSRLDFGFNMQKRKVIGYRTWSLGLINAYNRQNPYSIYKDKNGDFKQVVLFPITPFVSFKRIF